MKEKQIESTFYAMTIKGRKYALKFLDESQGMCFPGNI